MARPTGGFVKLHRKILQSWIGDDPVAAWMLCLLVMWANRSKGRAMLHRQLVTLERGQVATGRDELAKKLRCSKNKIDRIISRCEADGILGTKRGNQGSIITILNYDKYQVSVEDERTTDGAADRAADGAASGAASGAHREKREERRKNPPSEEERASAPPATVEDARALLLAGQCFAELDAAVTTSEQGGQRATRQAVMLSLERTAGDDWPSVKLAMGHLESFYTAFLKKRQRRTLNLFRDDFAERLAAVMTTVPRGTL